jgi:hypothetical protein
MSELQRLEYDSARITTSGKNITNHQNEYTNLDSYEFQINPRIIPRNQKEPESTESLF